MVFSRRSRRVRELKGNFSRIYLWKLFGGAYALGSATLVAYFTHLGVSLPLLFAFQAILGIVLGLLEVPTGLFADAFGRKTSLVAGSLLLTVGMICTATASHSVGLFMGQGLVGIGSVFMSGSDMGLLQGTLAETDRTKEGTEVVGRAQSHGALAMAVYPLIGALLAVVSLRLSWIVASVLIVPAAINLLFLREPAAADKKGTVKALLSEVPETLEELRQNKRLRGLLLFWALLLGIAQAGYWLYQPYMEEKGLSLPFFGVVYAVLSLGAGVAASNARRWRGEASWKLKLLAIAAIGVGALLPPFLSIGWGVLFFTLHQLIGTAVSVVLGGELFLEVESRHAATLFSVGSLGAQLICSLFLALLGVAVQQSGGLSVAFWWLGSLSIVGIVLIRIPKRSKG